MAKSGGLVICILILNVFLGMEVVGLTYRPFSWVSICDDEQPLYPPVYPPNGGGGDGGGGDAGGGGAPPPYSPVYLPVIHGIQMSSNRISVSVESPAGVQISLERSASLAEPDWQPVGDTVLNPGGMIELYDTNSLWPAAFYRALQDGP